MTFIVIESFVNSIHTLPAAGKAEIQDGASPSKSFETVGSRNIKNIGLAKIRKEIVKEINSKSDVLKTLAQAIIEMA